MQEGIFIIANTIMLVIFILEWDCFERYKILDKP